MAKNIMTKFKGVYVRFPLSFRYLNREVFSNSKKRLDIVEYRSVFRFVPDMPHTFTRLAVIGAEK